MMRFRPSSHLLMKSRMLIPATVVTQTVKALAEKRGLLLGYLSMSFANASQEVLRSYGATNVKKLQETAAKYDPDGLFQKLQNDGFLLRSV